MKKIVTLLFIFVSFISSAEVKTVNIGEFDLAYEISGHGKHIVLLEAGMGQSLSTWDPIYNDLSKLVTVIRYSRVGLGRSTQLRRQFPVESSVQHLNTLLNTLNIESPVILLSHSFGGIISRKFAATYPEKVKAMLLLDPTSEHDLNIMRKIDLTQAIKEISIMKTMWIENGLDNSYLESWSKRPMPNYPEIRDIPVVVIATVRKLSNPPMLLLTDKGRKLMGEWHKAWAEQFPQGRAILTKNSGHNIHYDEPKLVVNEFSQLLNVLNEKI